MKLITMTMALSLTVLLAAPVSAEVLAIVSDMDGTLANAGIGTGSLGTGSAAIEFDTDTKVLSWSITWSGLTGAPTAMHFHGPALPNQSAGVTVAVGVTGMPVVGNAVLTASQESDLVSGLWYINLHSATSPGGEIRGNLMDPTVDAHSLSMGSIKALYR
ncbi:MAG: hypothetical protein ACI9UK_001838 [Candidatus Krumholzibacteriia bacterium]|jgi:hypothetical protein